MKLAIPVMSLCVASLFWLGVVMLYSAGMAQKGAHYLLMQSAWGGIGLILCFALSFIDYRRWKKVAWILFVVAVALLVGVLLFGTKRNAARRWFDLGFFMFQPSEAAKFALVLMLAWYGDRYQRFMGSFWRGLILPLALIAVPLGLIFVEPDRGTTILLGAVALTLLVLAGVRWFYIIPPGLLALGALAYSISVDPVRMRRILSWLYPEEHKTGAGYQVWQGLIAFGAGGPMGLGLGNSRQKLGFLPEHHTDFILPVIGEELGLAATLGVVLAFILFVICGLYIAWRSREMFGFLLASGLTLLISLQAMINIGVVTSVFPNKGLPLPFVSYGGSNLLLMMGCIGVLFSIARHSVDPHEQADLSEEMDGAAPQPA